MRVAVCAAVLVCAGAVSAAGTVDPADLTYQGAFKLHSSWTWSTGGMAYYPAGDGGNGSLVVFGHAWYKNVGETAIDATPLKKSDGYTVGDLNQATPITQPTNSNPPYTPGFGGAGLEYLASTDKLYYGRPTEGNWGGYADAPSGTNPQGPYGLTVDNRRVGDFICEIPATWSGYTDGLDPGQNLLTGYDWAQYAYGLTMAAYDGDSPDGENNLPCTYLVAYDAQHPMNDWDRDDRWRAGAWLTVSAGGPDGLENVAVIVGGTKDVTNMGDDPDAPDDLHAAILFYDPADLDLVARGAVPTYTPQPYATLDVQDVMFSGAGLKGMAYDRANGVIYALEDTPSPIVHVWEVGGGGPPPPLPGDANRDGKVNVQDLSILATNWGKDPAVWEEGNFNTDTVVNVQDLSILATNWTGAATVPEPASAALLALGGLALIRRKS